MDPATPSFPVKQHEGRAQCSSPVLLSSNSIAEIERCADGDDEKQPFLPPEEVRPEHLKDAVMSGDVERVKRLINAGVTVNCAFRAPQGGFVTLLHVLSENPDLPNAVPIFEELLRGKANLNGRSSTGCTPLIRACLHKHLHLCEALLDGGSDVAPVNDHGHDAMSCAAMLPPVVNQRVEMADVLSSQIITLLVSKNMDINAIVAKKHKWPSLDENGRRAARQELGTAVDGEPRNIGGSSLYEAVKYSNAMAVTSLLQSGTSPRWLHEAVEMSSVDVTEALLNAKADPHRKNGEGQTPLDVALKRGEEEITNLLRDKLGEWDRNKLGSFAGLQSRTQSASVHTSEEVINHPNMVITEDLMESVDTRGSMIGPGGDKRVTFNCGGSDGPKDSKDSTMRNKSRQRRSIHDGKMNLRFSPTVTKIPTGGLGTQTFARAKTKLSHLTTIMSVDVDNRPLTTFEKFQRQDLPRWCRALTKQNWFNIMMFLALLFALFLPDAWVVFDMVDNSELDIVLTVVLGLFVIELVVQSIGFRRTYWGSFFFWMDLLGTVSMLLDLTYVVGSSALANNQMNDRELGSDDGGFTYFSDNIVVLRAARAAKLGARAGRFTKLVKVMRFIPGMKKQVGINEGQGAANKISKALTMALSTRVSCLIIVMVMILPIFTKVYTYPDQDWSMLTWLHHIEHKALTPPRSWAELELAIREFDDFYEERSLNYFPMTVQVALENTTTTWTLDETIPNRIYNTVYLSGDHVVFALNFEGPHQMEAIMNMALVVFVITLMVATSLFLSQSVHKRVVVPLEGLLTKVRATASTIFKSVTDMSSKLKQEDDDHVNGEEGGEEKNNGFDEETSLLEKVINKLAVVSEIVMEKTPDNVETLEHLGGIFVQPPGGNGTAQLDDVELGDFDIDNREETDIDGLMEISAMILSKAGLTLDYLDSWAFNPLDLDRPGLHASLSCMLRPYQNTMSLHDPQILGNFLEAVEVGYKKINPYHNFPHAVDVTHGVYKELGLCQTEQFLSAIERCALLIGGVCHDIGHPGLNNPFLVETSHELGLLYNDRSPLENMHCAKTFEIVNNPKNAILVNLSKSTFQEVRRIIIEAILHTDMAHHFTMVKEILMLYEVNSVVLEYNRNVFEKEDETGEFPTREAVEVFRQADTKKLLRNLFLHASDISNPFRPFEVCKKWAEKVLEEFFLQGDMEKELGITVQMLNDRDKVNKPNSQIGFIEFLVSPLVFAMVKVLPSVEECCEQLLDNVKCWQQEWEHDPDANPTAEEREAVAGRISKLEAKYQQR